MMGGNDTPPTIQPPLTAVTELQAQELYETILKHLNNLIERKIQVTALTKARVSLNHLYGGMRANLVALTKALESQTQIQHNSTTTINANEKRALTDDPIDVEIKEVADVPPEKQAEAYIKAVDDWILNSLVLSITFEEMDLHFFSCADLKLTEVPAGYDRTKGVLKMGLLLLYVFMMAYRKIMSDSECGKREFPRAALILRYTPCYDLTYLHI